MSSDINEKAVPTGLLLKFLTVQAGMSSGVLPQGLTLVVGGVSYNMPDLVSKIAAETAVHTDIRDLRTLLEQKLLDRDQKEPSQRQFLDALEAAVKGYLGVDSASLVKFGYKPKKKPATPTPEERVAKAAKAKATREKNHPKPDQAPGGASPAKA
jgi:hypothetical protein